MKTVELAALERASILGRSREDMHGRCVLLAMKKQLPAALAMLELDGIARRIVLCPPDLPADQIAKVRDIASVDIVLTDDTALEPIAHISPQRELQQTEWVLLTSGTTGAPKLVVHDLSSLASTAPASTSAIWSTFYDIRRYGGLAILFRALIGPGSLVLSDPDEDPGAFLARANAKGVSHISGTPSHWRRALMTSTTRSFVPRYVRLSGEIADQTILDNLHILWPDAILVHAFASTEAGLAFEVRDRLAGFPASLLDKADGGVILKILDGSLRIHSPRIASRYLDEPSDALIGADGFVDTRDLVELREQRYHFVGRRDGMINVGGIKIYPEEVEGVINAHPAVEMSLVKARRSSITGSLIVADVVCKPLAAPSEALSNDIIEFCRRQLPRSKAPVSLRFVDQLAIDATGKLRRHRA
jgi:acyl-CoA synthetase (AMP-forming)/AMP-acid ligase II